MHNQDLRLKTILFFFIGSVLFLGTRVAQAAGANQMAEAQQWFNKAQKAYEKEQFTDARVDLMDALQADPNFSEAYLLKALLQYHDGDTESAQASLKRAGELPTRLPKETRDHLQQQASEIGKGITEQDSSHFLWQFHGSLPINTVWASTSSLDQAYNELGAAFGSFPADKIPVIVFTPQEFWEAWQSSSWLGGFFDKLDGKVRVRTDNPPGGDAEMIRRMRHELTHVFIHQWVSSELPLWFQEGVAQYYADSNASDPLWKDKRFDELQKQLRGAAWMSIDQIQSAISKKNVPADTLYLAYLESEALTLSISKNHEDAWIPSLVKQLRQGKPFDTAFTAVTGGSSEQAMEQLQHAWQ